MLLVLSAASGNPPAVAGRPPGAELTPPTGPPEAYPLLVGLF